MTHVRTIMLVALCASLLGARSVQIQTPPALTPHAAQQFAADSEKAERGDPDAAFRMAEAFESGRLGGVKDLNKALTYYKLAGKNGHKEGAARAMQLEVELQQSPKKPPPPPSPGR
jgi:TPR repeat protein